MESYLQTTIELIIGYFALLFGTRMMGRSSISEATPFDFVAVIVLGEFVGNAVYDPEVSIWRIIFTIVLWALLILGIDFLTMKNNKTRQIFESKPSIIINNGVIDKNELKRNKIDINRLQTLLRDKNIFSFREINYAILEPNGKVSVLKHPLYQNIQRQDFDLPIQSESLPVTVISDGELIQRNLNQIGLDKNWITQELNNRGIDSIKDVMYAEWSYTDGLFIQKKLEDD